MIIRYPPPNVLRANTFNAVCQSCLLSATRSSTRPTRNFSRTTVFRATITGTRPRLWAGFFSANSLLERAPGNIGRGSLTAAVGGEEAIAGGSEVYKSPQESLSISQPPPNTVSAPDIAQDLPHRRRQRARKEAAAAAAASSPSSPSLADLVLPPNSSSTLTETASQAPAHSLRRLLPVLLSLSKPRLSVLVVLTAMASYSLYPVPDLLTPSATTTPSLSPLTLLFLTTGTGLCAASANAFNMLYEPKWDALMTRTRNRPLVRGLISPRGAGIFAVIAGVVGCGALYYGVNPTVSFLGGLNIALYAAVYTPLKRISVVNTWVGAVVGGIPPLMGWAAAAGQSATTGTWQELLLGEQNIGAWLLASLLVAWQFPHFMSLSWSIREEYKNAGYKMLCWVNPRRNGRVALRYAVLMIPLCVGLCAAGVTEWSFAVLSAPVNFWLAREAWKFWRLEGQKGSARGLFWASVWHLPVVLVLAMAEKKGMWQRAWRAVIGAPDIDDEEWEEDDLEEEEEEEEPVMIARGVSVEGKKAALTVRSR